MRISRPHLGGTVRVFRPLLPAFRAHAGRLAIGFLFLLVVDLLQLQIPLVIRSAVDALTTLQATTALLLQYAGIILGLAAAIACFRFIWRYALLGHSRIIEESLRNRLYTHLQVLSPSFYQRTRTGDVMARSINDMNAVRMAMGMGVVALADALVLGTATIGFMLHISPRLTVIALIPMPLIVVFTRRMTRRMSLGYEQVQQGFSSLTERIREGFSGIRIIKAYAREPWLLQRVQEEGERYVSKNLHLARTLALFLPLMTVFTNLGLGVVVWFGGRLTVLDQISTGDFVAFTTYLNLMAWPLMALGWVTNLMQRGSASMRRINGILEEEPDIVSPVQPVRLQEGIRGNLGVDGLHVRYPEQESDVLRDIRFSIAEGETAALVGRVGSGKTTLLLCFPRMIPIPSNTVYMDGVDVTQYGLEDLRRAVGFVPQEAVLFSDTIRNNLLLGRKDIPDETLIHALDTAQLYEELRAMDGGLDAWVGERGLSLSGGQRQRLTLARALVSDPPVLILDDALSMVDTRTEERILNRVLAQRAGKTHLFVSNRLATIRRADRILVLEQGRLAEEGTHDDLMSLGGEYTTLYNRQQLERELET
ncbi:MAG: ABC transporter ATP-binding protein [Desulfobacteraceae bacterium]|jgi:ATP-binding cassette subfamily B protein